ncbi:MAG: SPOR domain-containing protein [Salinisphaera sp.]|jgi:cell division septation protein DedD|nr:SPOR domain-containing protein [Salinisphaera sp.]
MNDVMKKRLIGVAVLVIIGVLSPLLLSKCMHSSDDSDHSAMRVYNVEPNGSTQSAASSASNAPDQSPSADRSAGSASTGQSSQPPKPDAISPQSQPGKSTEGSRFSTPTVAGNQDSGGQQPSQSSASPPSRNAPPSAKPEPESESAPQQQTKPTPKPPTKPSTDNAGSAAQAQRNDSASGWVVQIASFGDEGNAQAMVKRLSKQYRASYAQVKVNGKTWYRVNVGPFASEDAARSTAASLRKQGRSPLVRHLP